MSTRTETVTAELTDESWVGGVIAGLAGAVAMTALMLAMGATNVLAGAIPGLYGLALPPNPAAGLGIHLSHGAVLGVGFAALVGAAGLDDARSVVGAGVAYGVGTWVVLAALVMPVWLDAAGFAMAPPFPNFAPPSLLWHLVYGVVAAGVYTSVREL